MVLGKLAGLGRPTIWTTGQGPTTLAVGVGEDFFFDIFILLYLFFPLSPSLWETVILSQNNQPTNQSPCTFDME